LPSLAKGKVASDMKGILLLTDKLATDTEEEVYSPAAILIGEYLKLKLTGTNAKKASERMSNKKSFSKRKRQVTKGHH
jgi:hypothetical protein